MAMSRRGEGRARFEQLRGLAQGRAWQRAVEELARANAEGEALRGRRFWRGRWALSCLFVVGNSENWLEVQFQMCS